MTTELKTLKDIELQGFNYKDGAVTLILQDCISMKVLRQEAIKWVKYLRQEALDAKCPMEILGDRDSVLEFIKFFNLTDEDLK